MRATAPGSAGFADVLGGYPAVLMADEITTPGDGQLRALFVSGGNPVISVPNGPKLVEALPELDLMVSLDLYVNDTNRYADYILPATTFLEREDFPIAVASAAPTPFIQLAEPVVAPRGEARQEWQVYDEIATRIGVEPLGIGLLQKLAPLSTRLPKRPTPRCLFELLLRLGPHGDRLGLRRGGLNVRKLRQNPHGIVLGDYAATGLRKRVVRHRGGKVRLDPPELVAELARLGDRHEDDPAYPLRLIGLRELRSHNSWMHNSPTLMRGSNRKHQARINPVDAAAAGVLDGAPVRIRSRFGEIETLAPAQRRGRPRHGRRPARLGTRGRRLGARQQVRRRQQQRARLQRGRRCRAAGGHGTPQRHRRRPRSGLTPPEAG